MISSDIIQINKPTVASVCSSISDRVKLRRLELDYTQVGLSARAGVNIETYRKFERSGEISLSNIVKIANALDMMAEFDLLFSQPRYQSLDDLLSTNSKTRKRGSRK